ncbi:DciA family protein [Streptomyces sp. AC550_RSS872]|uniref:DciA family protein n=1 Tax=Streptomyces sp. AC550_RSS872 TaxID=2823689 RepID=UPI0027E4A31F|nr:DciA family protein [Streptomyces sp. AC550_RSS872]
MITPGDHGERSNEQVLRPAHRCPESTAWATKLRPEQARVIEAANESAGRTVVRALRILAPGSMSVPDLDDGAPQSAAAPLGPAKTRESACEGYRRALDAHQSAAHPSRVDPYIAEAVERQTQAMRELSARAFPEPESAPGGEPASIAAARVQRRRESEATRALALRRARAERAARQDGTPAAAAEPASLRTTA